MHCIFVLITCECRYVSLVILCTWGWCLCRCVMLRNYVEYIVRFLYKFSPVVSVCIHLLQAASSSSWQEECCIRTQQWWYCQAQSVPSNHFPSSIVSTANKVKRKVAASIFCHKWTESIFSSNRLQISKK